MTHATVVTLAMVAVPVAVTGALLALDIITERKERRHAVQAFDTHVRELAARRAALATGDSGHGRA